MKVYWVFCKHPQPAFYCVSIFSCFDCSPLVKAANGGCCIPEAISTGNVPCSGWIWQEHTWYFISPSSVFRDVIAQLPASLTQYMAAAGLLLRRSISTHSIDIEPLSFGFRGTNEWRDTLAASETITNARKKVGTNIRNPFEDAII